MNNNRKGILGCVGRTPLVRLEKLFAESTCKLYGKLEMFNPGGSIKDRTACTIISRALEEKLISPGCTVIESTSGNLGLGLARICHYLDLRLILVTDPHINALTEKLLRTFGVEIVQVDNHDGNGGYLNARLAKVQDLLLEIPKSFWPDQYHNIESPKAHQETYKEILDELGHPPDYFFIATSTCGTIRGFADMIISHESNTKIVAVDAVGSVIFDHVSGHRLIPGMGASRPSDFIFKEDDFLVEHISDLEAIAGCKYLLRRESILAGGSTGAIIKAMERRLPELNDSTVVAIFPDSGERYLDTIYSDAWVEKNFGKKGVSI